MEIPRGQDVTVPVSVEIVGTNDAIKTGEGSVVTSLNAIELSCRPSQLPDYIEIDISEMNLNDKVFVKDLVAPVGEFVTDPEALVLNIMPATVFVEPEEVVEGEEGVEGEGAEGEDAEGEGGDAKADGDEEKKDD
jgi:large subunit ribosomal protein L25